MTTEHDARQITIVMDYNEPFLGSSEVMQWLKAKGVHVLSLSTSLVCRDCLGRGMVDAGPMYADSDCIRQSKPCEICDGTGRPPRFVHGAQV